MVEETNTQATDEVEVKEESKPEKVATPAPEEKKEEAPKEEAQVSEAEAPGEEIEVPVKFKKIVEEIETMSVLDLNELVKVFEKKFGVSATAVAAVASAQGSGEPTEEKSIATVELTDSGANKISVIKVVKEALGLGLKEAKDLVDSAPAELKSDMKMEEAEELKKKIEEAGGKVTLK